MTTLQPPGAPDVTVIAPPSGQLLLFCGFYTQGLLVQREYVPAFLQDPAKAGVLLIPPFAALAIQCYTALSSTDEIAVKRDPAIDDHFELTLTAKNGQRVRYYSSTTKVPPTDVLRQQRVNYLVTPRYVALVDLDQPRAKIAIIAEVPESEPCDYRNRFAHDPKVLRAAAQFAVENSRSSLSYGN